MLGSTSKKYSVTKLKSLPHSNSVFIIVLPVMKLFVSMFLPIPASFHREESIEHTVDV